MNIKQSFHLVLIALFVWTFQSVTIHSQQHLLQEETGCQLCHASEQIDLYHHENTQIVYNEQTAVEVAQSEEKVTVSSKFSNTQKPQIKCRDFSGEHHYMTGTYPLGYFSTAPPYLFSYLPPLV